MINEFDFEPLPGEIIVNSGPFSVTLEFLNNNSGDIFAPSVVHDGTACQTGKNLVFAIPGGWFDACLLGVTGDWLFYVVYRPADCASSDVGDERIVSSTPVHLFSPSPNPFDSETRVSFFLEKSNPFELSVFDLQGRVIRRLDSGRLSAGEHQRTWDGTLANGRPAPAGIYWITLRSGESTSTQKVVLRR